MLAPVAHRQQVFTLPERVRPIFNRHRARLAAAAEFRCLPHGSAVRAAGIVVGRQRPDTTSGVAFVTLEDETGCVNVIVRRPDRGHNGAFRNQAIEQTARESTALVGQHPGASYRAVRHERRQR